MLCMDHLDTIVDIIGKNTLLLQPHFERGTLTRDQAIEFCNAVDMVYSHVQALSTLGYAHRNVFFRKREYTPTFLLLASRMIDHDLIGTFNASTGALGKLVQEIDGYFDQYFCKNDYQYTIQRAHDKMSFHTTQLMLLTLAYLGSGGNDKFLQEFPLEGLGEFVGEKPEIKNLGGITSLTNVDAFVVRQFSANALRISKENIIIYLDENDEYRIYSVHDLGNGILDEEGNPLPAARYHELFEQFSTKRTPMVSEDSIVNKAVPGTLQWDKAFIKYQRSNGNGLEFARVLAHLRRGHVEVQSRTKNNEPITYSTKVDGLIDQPTNKVGILRSDEPGTAFTLYIPK